VLEKPSCHSPPDDSVYVDILLDVFDHLQQAHVVNLLVTELSVGLLRSLAFSLLKVSISCFSSATSCTIAWIASLAV
jgi:hypothetical protein